MATKFLTSAEYAEKLGITYIRVRVLCQQGRIKGAKKFGHVWMIPANAPDPRKSQGRPKGKSKRKS